jgi:ferredoxin
MCGGVDDLKVQATQPLALKPSSAYGLPQFQRQQLQRAHCQSCGACPFRWVI